MYIQKLTHLSPTQLNQLYELERNCGLDPYTPEMLLDCVENLDTFACMEGEQILGFLTLALNERYLDGCLYIVNLNVDAAHRRKGLATQLLLHGCRTCPFPGDFPVALDVTRTNPARHLYESLGFRPLPIPSSNGPEDVVMATTLEALLVHLQKP